MLQAVIRIGGRALRTAEAKLLAGAAFVLIFFLAVPFPLIVLGAGLIGFLAGRGGSTAFKGGGHGGAGGGVADADTLLGDELPDHARPRWRGVMFDIILWLALWLLPIAALLIALGPDHVFSQIAIFFAKMALVTFGGAYAVLAYVAPFRCLRGAARCRPSQGSDARHLHATSHFSFAARAPDLDHRKRHAA